MKRDKRASGRKSSPQQTLKTVSAVSQRGRADDLAGLAITRFQTYIANA